MLRVTNMNDIERKVWMRYFQDGLWDLYLGTLLLIMGLGSLLTGYGLTELQSMIIYIAALVVVMLLFFAAKRFISRPRIGTIKPGPKAKARKRKARLLAFISVAVGLVLFFVATLAYTGDFGQGLNFGIILPAIWAVNMLVIFGLGAYFLEFDRLYLIGFMYAIAVPLDIILKEAAGIDIGYWAFALPASVVLAIGAVVFICFLRDNPVLTMDDEEAAGV